MSLNKENFFKINCLYFFYKNKKGSEILFYDLYYVVDCNNIKIFYIILYN